MDGPAPIERQVKPTTDNGQIAKIPKWQHPVEAYYEYQPLDDRKPLSPEAILSFAHATRKLYMKMRESNPTLLISPQRGAGPIVTALETYAEQDGVILPVINTSIGTRISVHEAAIGIGPTDEEKESILFKDLTSAKEMGYDFSRVALVDEVQSGSTFHTASQLLLKFLSEHPGLCNNVFLGGIRDTYHNRPLMSNYEEALQQLRGTPNSHPAREVCIVDGDLFTVDRLGWLDTLIQDVIAKKGHQSMHDLLGAMRIVNTESKIAIETFILAGEVAPTIYRQALATIWETPGLKEAEIIKAHEVNSGIEDTSMRKRYDGQTRQAFLQKYSGKQLDIAVKLYDNLHSLIFANITQRKTLGKNHVTDGYIEPEEIINNRYNQLRALSDALESTSHLSNS